MKSFIVWIGLLASMLLFLLPQSASAKSLFEHSKTEVPAGQTAENVYVIGGDADIKGHITGVLVVINGNLHLRAASRVDGAVVVIGGRVEQEPGASASDEIYNFALDTGTQTSLLIGGGMIAGLWVIQLCGSLLLILLPVLVRLIGRNKAAKWLVKSEETSWRKNIYLGAVSTVVLAAFSLLCIISIFGIPLLIVVLFLLLAALICGLTSMSYLAGGLFREKWIANEWIRLIAGAVLLAALANVPIIGGILLFLLMLYSLGGFVQWAFGRRKRA
ncbi:hypothetical protein [Paenibacillus pinistramenti]|uniref:hypothetical protein n=1 Tax=Paenibacillus pinistramenti TaxID=1768003 RepID=UPI001109BAEA|nr:hypothetical protein [Paenibacillus pinistramenti]